MGKKTHGGKGHEREKNDFKEANEVKEVNNCNNALSTGAEDGVKSSGKDKKNKKRRGINHHDVELSAAQSQAVKEDNVNVVEEKEKGSQKKRKIENDRLDGETIGKVEDSGKAGKKKKKKQIDIFGSVKYGQGDVHRDKEFQNSGGDADSHNNDAGNGHIEVRYVNNEDGKKDKKEKRLKSAKSEKRKSHKGEQRTKKGVQRTEKDVKVTDPSENPRPAKRSKKVSFSDQVEVFPSFKKNQEKEDQEVELVRGKRFSIEEDEMIKEAVSKYIEAHGLGEDGVDMILHCKNHPELKNCWKEIAADLPWRPYPSVYYRAHILYERAEKRSWTPEEYELIRRYHEKHGSDWRTLADALGKHRIHIKDTWRRIKLPNQKKGHWSQEEYQTLFDLVNMDLRMRVFEERKTKHGMLRDNISWGAISDKLATRHTTLCCFKWYNQLTSPMVSEGKWGNVDDYRLLDALVNLDACCVEDVDWDNLLEDRSGDLCRKRWNQMYNHIGHHGANSFSEQVEVLSKRYCPDLIETREAYDSKPAV